MDPKYKPYPDGRIVWAAVYGEGNPCYRNRLDDGTLVALPEDEQRRLESEGFPKVLLSGGLGKRIEFQCPDGRVLVAPPTELVFAGDPIPIVLDIEAQTRTRLKDGGNPLWFIRLREKSRDHLDREAGVSFAEYVSRRHPGKVEVLDMPESQGAKPTSACSRQTDAKVFADAFRQLAAEFAREMPVVGDEEAERLRFIEKLRLVERAGKLIMGAVERGFLHSLPNLPELVSWGAGKGPHPRVRVTAGEPGAEAMQARLVPTPGNVWVEVRGNHLINVRTDSGKVDIISDRHGGIIPDQYPDVVPTEALNDPASVAARETRVRDVQVCQILATMIEHEGSQTVGYLERPSPRAANNIPPEAKQAPASASASHVNVRERTVSKSAPIGPPEPMFVWRMSGNMWEIRFGDEHGNFADRKGFGILAKLLRFPNPSIPLTATSLLGLVVQEDSAEHTRQPVVTPEGIAAAKKWLVADYPKELEVAREEGVEAVEDLSEKKAKTEKYIRDATRLHGKLRAIGSGSPDDSARVSVKRNIDRTVDKLGEANPPMPKLVEHLKAGLRTEGSSYAYRPSTKYDWRFE